MLSTANQNVISFGLLLINQHGFKVYFISIFQALEDTWLGYKPFSDNVFNY